MKRRQFVKLAGVGAAALAARTAKGAPEDQAMRSPNVIFIMADDMGYGDLGCYGATRIPTPNMDRLADEGVRLTDAHSPSAVCTPTRYGVLTGRYCWRSRLKRWVLDGYSPPLIEPGRMTVASMLRKHGYATACIGKWHLGLGWEKKPAAAEKVDGPPADGARRPRLKQLAKSRGIDHARPLTASPLDYGFDYSYIIAASLDFPPYCFIEGNRVVGDVSVEKDPYHPQQRAGLMAKDWRDEAVGPTFTKKAVEWIERQAKTEPRKPFFLYLVPSAPHRPCVPPDFIEGKSQAGPRGDMVVEVDWTVGEIAKALDGLGLAGDTLLVVTSDNGARPTCFNGKDYGHKSCGDLRGSKADIWDGGHRIPCIARWPGRIEAGSTGDDLVCLTDLTATCAALVGERLPADAAEDSFNLLPLMDYGGAVREAVIHHSGGGMFSVRQGPWKLIVGLGSGGFTAPRNEDPKPDGPKGQLYDLVADPAEAHNLWQERPEVVEHLTQLLETYRKDGRSRPV